MSRHQHASVATIVRPQTTRLSESVCGLQLHPHGVYYSDPKPQAVADTQKAGRAVHLQTKNAPTSAYPAFFPPVSFEHQKPSRRVVSDHIDHGDIPESNNRGRRLSCKSAISNDDPLPLLMSLVQFFIPSVQIFSLSDVIPFYIQLQASSESLQHFLQRSSSPSLSSKLARKSSHQSTAPHAQPIVRVILQRHVSGIIESVRITRTFTIGEATVRTLPSDTSRGSNVLKRPEDGKETLDFQGEIKCADGMTVGGFSAGRLVVKVSPSHIVPRKKV